MLKDDLWIGVNIKGKKKSCGGRRQSLLTVGFKKNIQDDQKRVENIKNLSWEKNALESF